MQESANNYQNIRKTQRDFEDVGIQLGYAGDKDQKIELVDALEAELDELRERLDDSVSDAESAFIRLKEHIQTFVGELHKEQDLMMDRKERAIKNMKIGIINLLPAELPIEKRNQIINEIIEAGIKDITNSQAKIAEIIDNPLGTALLDLQLEKYLKEIVIKNESYVEAIKKSNEDVMKLNKGFVYGYSIKMQLDAECKQDLDQKDGKKEDPQKTKEGK